MLLYPDSAYRTSVLLTTFCLIADGIDDLQQIVDKIYSNGNRFGLGVSRTKTEVRCIEREQQQNEDLGRRIELVYRNLCIEDHGDVIA